MFIHSTQGASHEETCRRDDFLLAFVGAQVGVVAQEKMEKVERN
jgi:hypothetical protein